MGRYWNIYLVDFLLFLQRVLVCLVHLRNSANGRDAIAPIYPIVSVWLLSLNAGYHSTATELLAGAATC